MAEPGLYARRGKRVVDILAALALAPAALVLLGAAALGVCGVLGRIIWYVSYHNICYWNGLYHMIIVFCNELGE